MTAVDTSTGEIIEAGERAGLLEQVNRAEIDIQIATAHRFPRHVERATQRMKAMVCSSAETAGECFYVLPRAGKRIEGPSIRLAEIVAVNYGNIRVVTRPPIIGDREVTVEWAAHDLESNYATTGSVSTRITRSDKGPRAGQRYDDDMINVACLATTSKARRNGIYAIVPGTIIKELTAAARKMVSGGDKPIEARREAAMSHFRKFGVDDERILAAVGKSAVEQLDSDDLADLHGLATAIKEGHSTIDESFPRVGENGKPVSDGAGDLNRQVDEAVNSGKPAATAQDPAAEPKPAEEPKPGKPKGKPKADKPADGGAPPIGEQLAIELAQTCGCDVAAATERLDTYTAKLFGGITVEHVDGKQAADIRAKIASGAIKV